MRKINKTIKEVTLDISNFKYNLAIIKIRSLFEDISSEKEISKKDFTNFLKLLHIFCPHITEELSEKIGNKKLLSLEKWPVYDEKKINPQFELEEQVLEKTVSDILNVLKIISEKNKKEAKRVFIYVIPTELKNYNEDLLSKKIGLPIKIFAVNDKEKYDPEKKSEKAKPGKPGIFIE